MYIVLFFVCVLLFCYYVCLDCNLCILLVRICLCMCLYQEYIIIEERGECLTLNIIHTNTLHSTSNHKTSSNKSIPLSEQNTVDIS